MISGSNHTIWVLWWKYPMLVGPVMLPQQQKYLRPNSGPWINIKMSSYLYRKSHCGNKTDVRSSYLHTVISYTGKMTSLYWIRAQVTKFEILISFQSFLCCLLRLHNISPFNFFMFYLMALAKSLDEDPLMMTSSNGNIFSVTGPLCGEFTGHRWIPLTKASDAELWCFLWSTPE